MTQEQYNKLNKYESMFHSAIEAKYIRAIPREQATDFISVCHELCIHINTSCPACVLQAAQTLGKLYFDYKEQNTESRVIPSADKADYTESVADSIDLFEELPKSSKSVKPGKTANTNKKASQNVNKQAQKKKSK